MTLHYASIVLLVRHHFLSFYLSFLHYALGWLPGSPIHRVTSEMRSKVSDDVVRVHAEVTG